MHQSQFIAYVHFVALRRDAFRILYKYCSLINDFNTVVGTDKAENMTNVVSKLKIYALTHMIIISMSCVSSHTFPF